MNKIIYPIQLILCLLLVATTLSAAPEAEYRKLSKTWTVNRKPGPSTRMAVRNIITRWS